MLNHQTKHTHTHTNQLLVFFTWVFSGASLASFNPARTETHTKMIFYFFFSFVFSLTVPTSFSFALWYLRTRLVREEWWTLRVFVFLSVSVCVCVCGICLLLFGWWWPNTSETLRTKDLLDKFHAEHPTIFFFPLFFLGGKLRKPGTA